ncbi:hypothetical protein EV13_0005 [Prochlorococcus sp. MIT 0702]|nr:hypothetical protein EV13_0005 [Prochlorococcus sp. MIT 0702]
MWPLFVKVITGFLRALFKQRQKDIAKTLPLVLQAQRIEQQFTSIKALVTLRPVIIHIQLISGFTWLLH